MRHDVRTCFRSHHGGLHAPVVGLVNCKRHFELKKRYTSQLRGCRYMHTRVVGTWAFVPSILPSSGVYRSSTCTGSNRTATYCTYAVSECRECHVCASVEVQSVGLGGLERRL